MTLDKVHGTVGEEIGEVLSLFNRHLRVGLKIKVEPHGYDGLIETPFLGMVAPALTEVPFSKQGRCIPGAFQTLGNGHLPKRQFELIVHGPQGPALPVKTLHTPHRVKPRACRILTAQQRSTRRLAVLAVVVVG